MKSLPQHYNLPWGFASWDQIRKVRRRVNEKSGGGRNFAGEKRLAKKLEKSPGLLLTVGPVLDTINSTTKDPHSLSNFGIERTLTFQHSNGLSFQGDSPYPDFFFKIPPQHHRLLTSNDLIPFSDGRLP